MKRRIAIILVLIFLCGAMLCIALSSAVVISTVQGIVSADSAREGEYSAILVLGAGIINNERPTPMLRDRLDTAIELYFAGVSEKIVLSGDDSGEDYDEVTVMRNHCLSNGVPKEAIVEDREGFSTLESIHNLKYRFGYSDVLIVTQKYHLHRALYIADSLDIEARGISADKRDYSGQLLRDIREIAARIKDFIVVNLAY